MTEIDQIKHDRDVSIGRLEGRVSALEDRVNRRETADDERWNSLIKLVNDVRDTVTGWKAQERLLLLLGGGSVGAIMTWVGHTVFAK
jgi:hypothetical protein